MHWLAAEDINEISETLLEIKELISINVLHFFLIYDVIYDKNITFTIAFFFNDIIYDKHITYTTIVNTSIMSILRSYYLYYYC